MFLIKLGVIFKGIIRESMGILEHLSFVLPIKITNKNIISNIKTIIILKQMRELHVNGSLF